MATISSNWNTRMQKAETVLTTKTEVVAVTVTVKTIDPTKKKRKEESERMDCVI